MTIQEICERTPFSPREVRYVFEHDLSTTHVEKKGRGNARQLTDHQAFCCTIACYLKRGGMTRKAIKWHMQAIGARLKQNVITIEQVPNFKVVVDLFKIRKELGLK